MLIHGDTLPEGALIDSDVCIVGAGPIGLQLALALVARGHRVTVVESGEDGPNRRAQDLNVAESVGRWPGDPRDIRIRQLGGTMHVWGGNCRPLDPNDFRVRPWVEGSGWPLALADLAPYYDAAHVLLALDEMRYRPAEPALEAAPDFEEILFRLSPHIAGTHRGRMDEYAAVHRPALEAADNPRILLGTTVRDVLPTPDGRAVAYLHAVTFAGRELHLRARAHVFAAGGIETARLLLASEVGRPGAAANAQGALGRYFMEHPHGLAGLVLAPRALKPVRKFSPGQRVGTSTVQHRFRLTDAAQAREGALNLSLKIIRDDANPEVRVHYEAGFAALEATVADPAAWKSYYLVFLAEQEPNPDSRITLGTARDFFGVPQARIDWRLTSRDLRTIAVGTRLLHEQVLRAPQFRFLDRIPEPIEGWGIGWGAHHMGTTRMSATPRDGVVDRNCRIHGLDNAFVAGSSVFPTAGMANPMLTALALALRLARHLDAEVPAMTLPDMPAHRRTLAETLV